MREKILEIIQDHPKHYNKLIKRDPVLFKWVMDNTLVKNTNWPGTIYSAIYQQSDICERGRKKKFKRFSTGFSGCGPSSVCECTKSQIKEQVSKTKSQTTSEQQTIINLKRQRTMIAKYGVEFNSQRSDIKHIWTKNKIADHAAVLLQDRNWLNEQYNQQKKTLVDIADDLGVYYSTVAEYCKKHGFEIRRRANYSLEEKQISAFLDGLGIEHECGNWSILGNTEIDIYIPSHQLAIEVNGLYWHSWTPQLDKPEYVNRHLDKTLKLLEKNISLIHITDYEWNNKNLIVKNIIKSKLGLNQRIYARSCQIQQVSTAEQRKFLDQYHLQGYASSQSAWGLYHDQNLVQLITLGKSRFDSKANFEIIRFCTIDGLTVVGGLSKLVSQIKSTHPNSMILTYCDRSKSQAQGYLAAGFQLVRTTKPGYCWTDGNVPISRHRCQKQRLQQWLLEYDATKSESANMFDSGYRRYWDCGNLVLEL